VAFGRAATLRARGVTEGFALGATLGDFLVVSAIGTGVIVRDFAVTSAMSEASAAGAGAPSNGR
jgi:hypothetical protein